MAINGDGFNVLVVGAGGIGCELLKNLVFSGFKRISIVDLDTIDVSNLNRQFLFRKEHVGKSKAEVAANSIKGFRNDVNLKAYHASIFSSQFGPEFFEEFDIVFNALDNQAARRHVNRMCVNIGKAVIESGTSGYLGQVEPLLFKGFKRENADRSNGVEGRASCFECQPVENDRRSYPTCTIRNTPSEPIHCVVWAKFLFNQLFGTPDIDDDDISPDLEDPENTNSQPDSVNTEKQVKPNASNLSLWDRVKQDKLASHSVEEGLAWRLFHTDVLTLTSMRSLWENRPERKQPDPLDSVTLTAARTDPGLDCVSTNGTEGAKLRDQRKLTLTGWLSVFISSCRALRERTGLSDLQTSSTHSALTWDKDDTEAMDFVAAASAVRAILFHVPGSEEQTRFTAKSLAGNIVPAIATTNAIIAGVMVLQGLNVLQNRLESVRTVYLRRQPAAFGRLLVPCRPSPANPACLVCSQGPARELQLICFPEHMRLCSLRDDVLIRRLGMLAPDVEIDGRGVILISSDEEETKDIENKTLADFLHASCRLRCDDFRQNMTFYLRVTRPTDAGSVTLKNDASEQTLAPNEWKLLGEWEALASEATAESEVTTEHQEQANTQSRKRRHDEEQEGEEEEGDLLIVDGEALNGPTRTKVARLEGSPKSQKVPVEVATSSLDEDLISNEESRLIRQRRCSQLLHSALEILSSLPPSDPVSLSAAFSDPCGPTSSSPQAPQLPDLKLPPIYGSPVSEEFIEAHTRLADEAEDLRKAMIAQNCGAPAIPDASPSLEPSQMCSSLTQDLVSLGEGVKALHEFAHLLSEITDSIDQITEVSDKFAEMTTGQDCNPSEAINYELLDKIVENRTCFIPQGSNQV
nr:unnamed protein product [Spirometra erinaceieuropaei]